MGIFIRNSTDFAADCARTHGECVVARENILLLDSAQEHIAIDHLQRKCGSVVIIPDLHDAAHAWLYHTSCERMGDVVERIFNGHLHAPSSVARPSAEMVLGELHRRRVALPYADCKARVEGFDF